MRIAVEANVRTTLRCCESINDGYVVAMQGGQALGFLIVGIGLFVQWLLI